eukprot:TRINITY_DN3650_c1_g1_i1.p1 TRINITY_DN3650_c1_g1~~TRINITY_DN3650_c1_g1_i1.p1  ORF type:complete len:448 (-),score=103.41 TRINITY_DN3650_c1_g1_i1:78-1277(-)
MTSKQQVASKENNSNNNNNNNKKKKHNDKSTKGGFPLFKWALAGLLLSILMVVLLNKTHPNIPVKLMMDGVIGSIKLHLHFKETFFADPNAPKRNISAGAYALNFLFSMSPPMNWTDTVEVRKQVLEGMGPMVNAYFPPLVRVVEIAPNLIAEVQPTVTATTKRSDVKHMIYLHGGAFLAGHPSLSRTFLHELIKRSNDRLQVWALDYRLAPEHPLPAATEDAVLLYDHLVNKLGVDPANIVIAGDSAGGGLSLMTLLAIKDSGRKQIAGGILIAPCVDMYKEYYEPENGIDKILQNPLDLLASLATNTSRDDRESRKNPIFSPLYGDLKGLPPLYINIGTNDELWGQNKELQKRALEQGVKVVYSEWKHLPHVFPVFFSLIPEGEVAIGEMIDFIYSS